MVRSIVYLFVIAFVPLMANADKANQKSLAGPDGPNPDIAVHCFWMCSDGYCIQFCCTGNCEVQRSRVDLRDPIAKAIDRQTSKDFKQEGLFADGGATGTSCGGKLCKPVR